MEQFRDGLYGEIDGGDAFFDDASNLTRAEWNEDDVTGLKFLVGRIGENCTAGAEDFCGDDLEKHDSIIARPGMRLRLWRGVGDFRILSACKIYNVGVEWE